MLRTVYWFRVRVGVSFRLVVWVRAIFRVGVMFRGRV